LPLAPTVVLVTAVVMVAVIMAAAVATSLHLRVVLSDVIRAAVWPCHLRLLAEEQAISDTMPLLLTGGLFGLDFLAENGASKFLRNVGCPSLNAYSVLLRISHPILHFLTLNRPFFSSSVHSSWLLIQRPCSILVTRFSENYWVCNGVHSASCG
jgi:hypothetical protein